MFSGLLEFAKRAVFSSFVCLAIVFAGMVCLTPVLFLALNLNMGPTGQAITAVVGTCTIIGTVLALFVDVEEVLKSLF